MVATARTKGKPKVKNYPSPSAALIDHIQWLHDTGKFNSMELAQRMRDANVPKDLLIGESMFRMLERGAVKRMVDERAVEACRVFGISIAAFNPAIPENFKAKPRPKSNPGK